VPTTQKDFTAYDGAACTFTGTVPACKKWGCGSSVSDIDEMAAVYTSTQQIDIDPVAQYAKYYYVYKAGPSRGRV